MMRVTKKSTEQLVIEGAPRLDPITVTIEDHEPGKGKLTVSCYGKSWTAYWGGMSGQCVADFIAGMNTDYVANCLWRGTDRPQEVVNWDDIATPIRAEIVRMRKHKEIGKSEARDCFDDAKFICDYESARRSSLTMVTAFGDDWHMHLPETPVPEWTYLKRIVDAVRAGVALQPETSPERLAEVTRRITEWRDVKLALDAQLDTLSEVMGTDPESPLFHALTKLWDAHSAGVMELIGNTYTWLDWYEFECGMGARPSEASAGKDMPLRPIETPEDLARLILGMEPA